MPTEENLADLFAKMWKIIEASDTEIDQALEAASQCKPQLREKLTKLCELDDSASLHAWACGDLSLLPAHERFLPPHARALLVARAIDGLYSSFSPTMKFRNKKASVVWRTLVELSRLNANPSLGQVIFKRPLWGRWADETQLDGRWADPKTFMPHGGSWGIADHFNALQVLPLEVPASDADDPETLRQVQLTYRVQFFGPQSRNRPFPEKPLIGLAALAETEDDIAVEIFEESGRHWYDAKPRDLEDRAAQLVKGLCGAGVHIIVFPEATMSSASLVAVRQAVRTFGPDSELRIVVAGTTRKTSSGQLPANEAVILNHRGQILYQQPKLHRWNLDADQRSAYNFMAEGLEAGAKLYEYIEPGRQVTIVELEDIGRFLVMICEDLGRSQPGQVLRSSMRLDWVFTPILDKAIATYRWMSRCGYRAAIEGGSRVVIANSIPLALRANRVQADANQGPPDRCGTGLLFDCWGGASRRKIWEVQFSKRPFQIAIEWGSDDWECGDFH